MPLCHFPLGFEESSTVQAKSNNYEEWTGNVGKPEGYNAQVR